jgi:chloramphenicol 3-O-phosphotransferase
MPQAQILHQCGRLQHPTANEGSARWYHLALHPTGIYTLVDDLGTHRSCPQEWAREIHHNATKES